MSPTARSLAECRKLGLTAQVVEKWIPQRKIRIDLFGFIDVVACGEGYTIGIQATSGDHVAERIAKIRAHENFPRVLAAGWEIQVWGWSKRCSDGRGSRKTWQVRKELVTLEVVAGTYAGGTTLLVEARASCRLDGETQCEQPKEVR